MTETCCLTGAIPESKSDGSQFAPAPPGRQSLIDGTPHGKNQAKKRLGSAGVCAQSLRGISE
jgi:hypothetical protein